MNKTIISDLLTGKNVWKYYQEYTRTQWLTLTEAEALQVKKLRNLLAHCYDHIPYYRKLIDERQIDINGFTSTAVLNEFPVLTKEIIQEHFPDFMPDGSVLLKGVKSKQTGGTTGNILFNRNDANTRSSTWATFKRYEDWMGYTADSRTLILMGGHVKHAGLKEKVIQKASSLINRTTSVDIYNTSDETVEKVIKLIESDSFSFIRSYPQFLYNIARIFESRNLEFRIKGISTTAEPVMPEHRRLFRKVFHAEVFDQYGCGEIGGIAYECDHHEGMHIAVERVIVELNEQNELILTDLDNYTMPFIRYWNADQAVMGDSECSCGRKSPLIKQILGRTCDYVSGADGQFLHWAYFWHLIFDSNIAQSRQLRKFQIVQAEEKKLVFRLVSDPLSEEEKDFILTDIKSRLGELTIEFKYESEIENTKTGKYRPVINKLI
jgi:phenylacetate-CoA ligase